jgi:hypothetical protein
MVKRVKKLISGKGVYVNTSVFRGARFLNLLSVQMKIFFAIVIQFGKVVIGDIKKYF